jgi:3-oxoacyl-[acyl-carrier protein] reductase
MTGSPLPAFPWRDGPTSDRFVGRVALVTGAGGAGMGDAIAARLASEGASIVAVDTHGPRVEAAATRLRDRYGVDVRSYTLDVARRPEVDAMLTDAAEHHGAIDIVVNNAAVNPQGSVWSYDADQFDDVIDIDLNACWYLIRQTVWPMRELGRGSIVNIGSIAAWNGGRGREAPYSAAKAGLHEITRSVAIEVGPYNIRCNAIAPGLVQSKFVEKHWERFKIDAEQTPLRRHAWPEEVANVAAFLVSDESSFITGEVVVVSGGSFLHA